MAVANNRRQGVALFLMVEVKLAQVKVLQQDGVTSSLVPLGVLGDHGLNVVNPVMEEFV